MSSRVSRINLGGAPPILEYLLGVSPGISPGISPEVSPEVSTLTLWILNLGPRIKLETHTPERQLVRNTHRPMKLTSAIISDEWLWYCVSFDIIIAIFAIFAIFSLPFLSLPSSYVRMSDHHGDSANLSVARDTIRMHHASPPTHLSACLFLS